MQWGQRVVTSWNRKPSFFLESRRATRYGCLHGVLPFRLAVGDAGVEVKKHGLAGAIAGLLGNGKIELPPARQRQVRRIAERYALAEACFKPSKEAIETPPLP